MGDVVSVISATVSIWAALQCVHHLHDGAVRGIDVALEIDRLVDLAVFDARSEPRNDLCLRHLDGIDVQLLLAST